MNHLKWALLLLAPICLFARDVNNNKTAANPKTLEIKEDVRMGADRGDDYLWFKSGLSVAVNSEGTMYVADPGNVRIAVIDKDGEFVRNIGREGKGPGEFTTLNSIQVLNDDSIVVTEVLGPQFKVHTFDPDGEYVDTKSGPFGLILQGANVSPNGKFLGGIYVKIDMSGGPMDMVAGTLDMEFKPVVTVASVTRSSPDVSRFGEGAYWSEYMGENMRLMRDTGTVAFDRDGRVYAAKISKYEISIYEPGEEEPWKVHKDYDPIPNPEEEIQAFVEPIRSSIVDNLPPQLKSVVTEQVIAKAVELADYPPVKTPIFGIVPIDGVGFGVVHDVSFRESVQRLDLFNQKGTFIGTATIGGLSPNALGAQMVFRDGYLYRFVSTEEEGEPDLVRYTYRLVDAQ